MLWARSSTSSSGGAPTHPGRRSPSASKSTTPPLFAPVAASARAAASAEGVRARRREEELDREVVEGLHLGRPRAGTPRLRAGGCHETARDDGDDEEDAERDPVLRVGDVERVDRWKEEVVERDSRRERGGDAGGEPAGCRAEQDHEEEKEARRRRVRADQARPGCCQRDPEKRKEDRGAASGRFHGPILSPTGRGRRWCPGWAGTRCPADSCRSGRLRSPCR